MEGRARGEPLSRTFYERNGVAVARNLLGQRLVRVLDGRRLSGLICETEAYSGPDDQASHAFRRTPRSAIMFGPAGYAYVYFIYGTHYCLNAVTDCEGCPGAVLVRALIPDEGIDSMCAHRGMAPARPTHPYRGIADGPGKLCQAMAITGAQNGHDLTLGVELWVEAESPVADDRIQASSRIGVRGDVDALARPWRFVWRP